MPTATPRTRPVAAAALAAALAFAAPAARGQVQPVPAPPPAQLPWIQAVSVNPVGIPFGVFSAEYEVALAATGVTAGVGGTVTANSFAFDRDDRWISGRVMYYPGEVALRGFAVGVTLGAHRAEREEDETDQRARDAGATLGILGTYNYLVGRQQRLVLGAGLGFRRVLKTVRDDSPLRQAYPDGRVVLGFAF